MSNGIALVLTSISPPSPILAALAGGTVSAGMDFIIAGDTRSPAGFELAGCEFLDIPAQLRSGFRLASLCPTRHYARKNIGYLAAIRRGAHIIVETDDDNWPLPGFFAERVRRVAVRAVSEPGWVNVYRYFTDTAIWPRGLPLDYARVSPGAYETLALGDRDCPIQQGLADENPDVDAIYRLVLPLPQYFHRGRSIALKPPCWCPFNSQNTTWWTDAFPLLYLPAHCSFRMTDIWRSFVAQRIASENDWWILFHEATVRQERNEHNLMRDFEDEIPGYLHNRSIAEKLDATRLVAGREHMAENLRRCYGALIELGVIAPDEMTLVDAWLADLRSLGIC